MESLSEEVWDVIIAGTSLPQSLLALALSKCDLKVLHVDQNDYYGGSDAGLSINDAQAWIDKRKADGDTSCQIQSHGDTDDTSKLGPSRAYTLSLNPQIIYAKSRFLPTLVSSQLHSQLEFQAVGSFFVLADDRLQKIPSNREDVFADDTLSVRDKRKLMGLLRFVVEDQDDTAAADTHPTDLQGRLESQFRIPSNLLAPIQALTLTTDLPSKTNFDTATVRLKRHLMSTGYFGPGLAAVMAKYGGNSEIAQVACRAGAVGGFVYLLGHGVKSVAESVDSDILDVELSQGIRVQTKHLVGTQDDLPKSSISSPSPQPVIEIAHNITIVSKPLRHLFSSTSDNGPVPAVAIVLDHEGVTDKAPIYLQIHSEDTGECPTGQCIIYASTISSSSPTPEPHARLKASVTNLLATTSGEPEPAQAQAIALWSMSYTTTAAATTATAATAAATTATAATAAATTATAATAAATTPANDHSHTVTSNDQHQNKLITLPNRRHDISFDDSILDTVKAAWGMILGEKSAEYDFLRFEERREDEEGDAE